MKEPIGIVHVASAGRRGELPCELRISRDRERGEVIVDLVVDGHERGAERLRMTELEIWTLVRLLESARRPLAQAAEDRG